MERTDTSRKPPKVAQLSRSKALTAPVKLALAAALLCAFAGLAGNVTSSRELGFDLPVMRAVRHLESSWLTIVMQATTATASVLGTIVMALALCIHWWRQVERRPEAIALAVTLAGSAALGQAIKLVFARPRPHLFPWLTAAGGWSFPSGHTLNAVILAGLLAWLVGRRLSGRRRVVLDVVVGLWAALVGLSRVYLGVHYPSDVLASVAVGGLCLLAAWGVHRFVHTRQER
jgi:membrane-associated phospholipid phosphatase